MKLTKGRIKKLYNKKRQSHKKAKKGKKSNKQTFRKRHNYNLHKKTLKRIDYKKGGQQEQEEQTTSVMKNVLNLENEPEPEMIKDIPIQTDTTNISTSTTSDDSNVYDFDKVSTPLPPATSTISEELFSPTENQNPNIQDEPEPLSESVTEPLKPEPVLESEPELESEPIIVSKPEPEPEPILEPITESIPELVSETISEEKPESSSSIKDDVTRLIDNFTEEVSEKVSDKVSIKLIDKLSNTLDSSIGTQEPIGANQRAAETIASDIKTQIEMKGGKKKTRRFKIKSSKTKKNK